MDPIREAMRFFGGLGGPQTQGHVFARGDEPRPIPAPRHVPHFVIVAVQHGGSIERFERSNLQGAIRTAGDNPFAVG
jgi:hypothetical protein